MNDMIKLVCVFCLGDSFWGIRAEKIIELIEPDDITQVCNSAPSVMGIINLRGRIITVFDLALKIGITEEVGDFKRGSMIIVDNDEDFIGYWVKEIDGFIQPEKDQISPPPIDMSGVEQSLIEGIFNTGDKLVAILNSGKIIDYSK